MHAESAYLFRHALLRDAAYELQMPADRSRLHEHAMEILQSGHEVPAADSAGAHPLDAACAELARHARAARLSPGGNTAALIGRETLFLRRAAAHAMRQYQRADEVKAWLALAELERGAKQAIALCSAALVMLELPDGLGQARSPAQRALQQAADDPAARGKALRVLGECAYRAGQPREAEDLYTRALEALSAAGLQRDAANLGNDIGNLLMHTGRYEEAEARFRRTLQEAADLGDQGLVGAVQGNLASLCDQTGRREQALQAAQAAIASFRACGMRAHEGIMLSNMAAGMDSEAERAQQMQLYEQAMQIHRETGNLRSQAITLLNMGNSLHAQSKPEQAGRLLREAQTLARNLGDRRSEAGALRALALIEAEAGGHDAAQAKATRALQLYARQHDPRGEALARCHLALVMELAGTELNEVETQWQQGVRALEKLGDASEVQRMHELRSSYARQRSQAQP